MGSPSAGRRSRRRIVSLLMIGILAAQACASCTYFKDRLADLTDPFRVVGGAGTEVGLRFSNLGLWDTGLLFGLKPQATSLGWKYGRPVLLGATARPSGFEADQSWVFVTTSLQDWNYATDDYKLARKSAGVLPCLLTWADTTERREPTWYVPEKGLDLEGDSYLWTAATWKRNRYAMIHAFDIEQEIAFLLYLDFGFSPGEGLDFLLGIFTIDLAGDDGRLGGGDE